MKVTEYLNFDLNARSSLPMVDGYKQQAISSATATNNIASLISSSVLTAGAFKQAKNDISTKPEGITGFGAPSIRAVFTAWTTLHAPSAQMASSVWKVFELAFVSNEGRMVRGYKLLSETVYISSIASNLMSAKYTRQLRAASMIFQGAYEVAQALSVVYEEYKNDKSSKTNILVAIMQAALGSLRLCDAHRLLTTTDVNTLKVMPFSLETYRLFRCQLPSGINAMDFGQMYRINKATGHNFKCILTDEKGKVLFLEKMLADGSQVVIDFTKRQSPAVRISRHGDQIRQSHQIRHAMIQLYQIDSLRAGGDYCYEWFSMPLASLNYLQNYYTNLIKTGGNDFCSTTIKYFKDCFAFNADMTQIEDYLGLSLNQWFFET